MFVASRLCAASTVVVVDLDSANFGDADRGASLSADFASAPEKTWPTAPENFCFSDSAAWLASLAEGSVHVEPALDDPPAPDNPPYALVGPFAVEGVDAEPETCRR